MRVNKCGVLRMILDNGIFEVNPDIDINVFKNKSKMIETAPAIWIEANDANIAINPSITIPPNSGIAIILDSKNVRDTVLK